MHLCAPPTARPQLPFDHTHPLLLPCPHTRSGNQIGDAGAAALAAGVAPLTALRELYR